MSAPPARKPGGWGAASGADGQRAVPPLAILVALTAISPLALNIFMPSLPGLDQVFATDASTVQLTLSLFLIGFAGAQLAYGPFSDRFGRRPPMIVGMILFLTGTGLCMLAWSIQVLILGRVIQAIGGCCGIVLSRAIVRDVYDRDEAAGRIAYIIMAMVVAPMIGPMAGGFLDDLFGWRAGFALTFIAGIAVFAFALRLLVETKHDRVPLPDLPSLVATYGSLLRRPAFLGYTAHVAFTSGGFFAFLGAGPLIVVDLWGYSRTAYGLFFAITAIGYMTGNFLASRFSQRLGIERMMMLGGTITVSGASLMLVLLVSGHENWAAVFLPMTIHALGNGICMPNGMAGAVSVDPWRAGTASGVSGFFQMAFGAATSTLVGALVTDHAWPMAAVITCTGSLSALTAWLMLRSASAGADDGVMASRPDPVEQTDGFVP
ncbi:MAG: multidrug effflux MFS transporter [Rhodospirillaceae bacterium]|nr:multidrug effflux MFS transporter [Rhodospirillaceae bacterium]